MRRASACLGQARPARPLRAASCRRRRSVAASALTESLPTVTVAIGVGLSQADRTSSPSGDGTDGGGGAANASWQAGYRAIAPQSARGCACPRLGRAAHADGGRPVRVTPSALPRSLRPRHMPALPPRRPARDAGSRHARAGRLPRRARRAAAADGRQATQHESPPRTPCPAGRSAAADADRAADHPGHLQQRLGAGERRGADQLRHVPLDQRVQRQLRQRLRRTRRPRPDRPPCTAPKNSRARRSPRPAPAASTVTMISSGAAGLAARRRPPCPARCPRPPRRPPCPATPPALCPASGCSRSRKARKKIRKPERQRRAGVGRRGACGDAPGRPCRRPGGACPVSPVRAVQVLARRPRAAPRPRPWRSRPWAAAGTTGTRPATKTTKAP